MLGVHGNVCFRERERKRTGLNVRKIFKREIERDGVDFKKNLSQDM